MPRATRPQGIGNVQPTPAQRAARVALLRELARWKASGTLWRRDLSSYPQTSALLATAKASRASRRRKFTHGGYRYELAFSSMGRVIVLDDGAALDAGLVSWLE